MPSGKPGGGAGSREEETPHAGDPPQELGAGASRRGEPERSSPGGDGGLLQDTGGSDHWSAADQLEETRLPSTVIWPIESDWGGSYLGKKGG